jgi:hypothetical protein
MMSVPPRGSGWVFGKLTIGNQETHPLPRGGTDLMTLGNMELETRNQEYGC